MFWQVHNFFLSYFQDNLKTWSGRENTSLQDPYFLQSFILTHDLGWSFSLVPLRQVLTIYPYIVNFQIFTNCHISPEWCHIICFVIIGNVSYQFSINYVILCHHICHFIIHSMSSLLLCNILNFDLTLMGISPIDYDVLFW